VRQVQEQRAVLQASAIAIELGRQVANQLRAGAAKRALRVDPDSDDLERVLIVALAHQHELVLAREEIVEVHAGFERLRRLHRG
jgi:hypothetical protein